MIARVELLGLVELLVALTRRVGSHAADASEGGIAGVEHGSEVLGMRAVDHEVSGCIVGGVVHGADGVGQCGAVGSEPSVSTVNEMTLGMPRSWAARAMPIASAVFVSVRAVTRSAPAPASAAICSEW